MRPPFFVHEFLAGGAVFVVNDNMREIHFLGVASAGSKAGDTMVVAPEDSARALFAGGARGDWAATFTFSA